MINSVTVTNYLNESITMELRHPEKTGLNIKDITGLSPSSADINYTEIASSDGGEYNSSRLSVRNIVFTIGFYECKVCPSIEDARQLTYKYFPLKKPLTITVETDNRVSRCIGYVESNEADIFSDSEEADISVICPDPYMYSLSDGGIATVQFNGVEDLFEFPFSSETANGSPNDIEFGRIVDREEVNVLYEGDADIGFLLKFHFIGEARQIRIYNTITRETMRIDTDRLAQIVGSGIQNGDDITISTVEGDKRITLLRNGEETNILNALDRNTDWFLLTKGDNMFAYTAEYGSENIQLSFQYQTRFMGV